MLHSRKDFFCARYPVESGMHIDSAAARCAAEYEYVRNLQEAVGAGTLAGYSDVSTELLFMPTPVLMVDDDGVSLPFGPEQSGYEPSVSLLRFERQNRHRLDAFVNYHMREAAVNNIDSPGLARRYILLPAWWRMWEVPYGARVKCPEFFCYASSWLARGPPEGVDVRTLWCLVKSEHALNCLKALYFHAMEDRRVYWFPEEVRRAWRVMGVRNMLHDCDPAVIRVAERLVYQVDRFRWSRCPPQNRQLPDVAGPHTPVFMTNGDWMPFDRASFALQCPREDFLEAAPANDAARESSGVLRGKRAYGDTSFLAGSRLGAARAPNSRLQERGGYSSKRYEDASRIFHDLLGRAGYTVVAARLGLPTRPLREAVSSFGRLLFHAVPGDPSFGVGRSERQPIWGSPEDPCTLRGVLPTSAPTSDGGSDGAQIAPSVSSAEDAVMVDNDTNTAATAAATSTPVRGGAAMEGVEGTAGSHIEPETVAGASASVQGDADTQA